MVVHGFEAGQLVVCRYRLPGELQPWIHEVHIGEVVEPGDDPAKRNTRNLGWLLRHTSEVQRIRFFPDPAGNVFGVYEHRPH